MNRELTRKLYEKYPAIFANRCGFAHGDGWYGIIDAMCEAMTCSYTTLLELDEDRAKAWGIQPFKSLGKGHLKYFMEVNPPQVVAVQVKEKLGTLRFYYHLEQEPRLRELMDGDNPLPEALKIAERYDGFYGGIVHLAKVLSGRTCEETGLEGEMHTTGGDPFGWRRTLNREFARSDEFCIKSYFLPLDDTERDDSRML